MFNTSLVEIKKQNLRIDINKGIIGKLDFGFPKKMHFTKKSQNWKEKMYLSTHPFLDGGLSKYICFVVEKNKI